MLNTDLLERKITKGRYTVMPHPVRYVGQAQTPHGGSEGSLYASGDTTYFVPFDRENGTITPRVSETAEVTSNPTGYHKDMTFAPVAPDVMDGGLRVALEAVIRQGHPRAIAEDRLTFN